jgi:putative DNA-invertase from lambdoid prophage Rac
MNWLLLPKSSGSVATTECNDFAKVADKLEADGVMIVTKLDRLGRNAMDVRATSESIVG